MKVTYDHRVSLRSTGVVFIAFTLALNQAWPQTPPAAAQTAVRIDPAGRTGGWLTRPYQARRIPPINLANTSRLDALIRGGNLYLSAQDVVALALENSIDIEVQRYGPLLAREVLRRTEGGGLLRSVGQGVAAGPVSVSLSGVTINTNGAPSAIGSGVSSNVVTGLGPTIPSFDPTITAFANFQHSTTPQSNTIIVGTTAFIDDVRTYQMQYTQNFHFGLNAQMTYLSTRQHVNSASFNVNPYTSGDLDLTLTQNLLNGFGSAVNTRNIRVQRNNLKVTDLQFKQQVIATVTSVLNLYWDLVSFKQDERAREQEVATAQQLLENNQRQVQIGTLADIEVTRAQSQLYAAKQDQLISQTNVLQQETILKNALSRQGVATSDLAEVHIVPLDDIVIPARDEIRPIDELTAEALRNRPEIETARLNVASRNLNLVGIRNGLKPSLQAFAEVTNNGLTGTVTPTGLARGGSIAYLTGGYDNLLAQIFRRNFPNYSAGFSLNIPLRNRAAQADYASEEIGIRQDQLTLQKQMSQVRVDVQNAVIGLQQARARYDAAVQGRILSQQTFDGDKRKYDLGAATPYQVVQDQRDLASAQSSEAQAMANYSHARIQMEQALGTTLEVNHISLEEAKAGHVRAAPSAPRGAQ
jgi:outer membrane protein